MVRDGSGDPRLGPGLIAETSGRSETGRGTSGRSGTGWGTLRMSGKGRGNLEEVQDGSGDPQ